MHKIRQFLARGAATHFVGISFLWPQALETRGFLRLMNRVFSGLAPSYDRLGRKLAPEEVILAPLRSWASALPAAPGRILDLACGTGLATLELGRRFPGAQVLAADLSESMIRILTGKAGAPDGPLALVCHSGALPFRDGRFDAVVTQNAPPYLGEMVRVLRPGGRLGLCYSFVFAGPVRRLVRRRLEERGLWDIRLLKAGQGIALSAAKPEDPVA